MRHVRLSSTPIWEPFGLQFNHSSLLICFTVEIEAGLRTPAQICEALNQGLVRVRSGMCLVTRGCKPENWIYGSTNLFWPMSQPSWLGWERGPNQASDLWGEPTLPTEPAPSLIMMGSPEIPSSHDDGVSRDSLPGTVLAGKTNLSNRFVVSQYPVGG